MSRVFEAEMIWISELSGCDWDFVVDMYNNMCIYSGLSDDCITTDDLTGFFG